MPPPKRSGDNETEMNLMGAKRGHFKREETQQEMKSRDETR